VQYRREKHARKIPEQSSEMTRHASTTWIVFILDMWKKLWNIGGFI
jgi:hypothetical protein